MLLVVGRIGRAHGVRGDVFVEPLTDEPDVRFADGSVLTTNSNTELTVELAKWHSGKLVVHFVGVDDRTLAEQLKTLELSVEVDPAVLPEDPNEFYDHQLVGLSVRLEDATEIGTVKEVIHLPAQDLLAVTTPDAREVLIPFVTEFVPVVDITGGFISITPPPGLLNEDEAIEVRDEI
ncbi:MAG: ribosome maturation factor RimM [Actinomycetes bacterium]